MADQKISALTADASPTLDDLLVTVNDPSGTPANRKATLAAVLALALSSNTYLQYRDEKTQNTAGGTFTAGSWQTRVLNTEVSDAGGLGSLASNQITLAAGTYYVSASAPTFVVNRHQLRLQNVTDGVTLLTGLSNFVDSTISVTSTATLVGVFTIAASKAIELQHRCQTTKSSNGLGVESNFTTEIYAVIEFWRLVS